jgi:hypothetical protein
MCGNASTGPSLFNLCVRMRRRCSAVTPLFLQSTGTGTLAGLRSMRFCHVSRRYVVERTMRVMLIMRPA